MKIIDMHTHTGNKRIHLALATLERMLKKYGIDNAAVFPMFQDSCDALVEESIRNSKNTSGFFFPFLRFNPTEMKLGMLEEISPHFSGFKFHPRAENFNVFDKRLEKIFDFIESTGKPVIIHSRKENNCNSDPDRLVRIAGLYPGINFIFAHFANDSDEFFREAAEYENAYVETSIVSSPKIIERRVDEIGAERFVFGSDTPFSDPEIELLKITKSRLTKMQKESILSKNAFTLLKRRKRRQYIRV